MIKVDEERGAIVVHGSVPGKPGNVLEITTAKIVGKTWKYQRWDAHAGCCSLCGASGAAALHRFLEACKQVAHSQHC